MGTPATPPRASVEPSCKHPKVRVVARDPDEDVEYVECQECGEVFDSHEFQDMEIEEKEGTLPFGESGDEPA